MALFICAQMIMDIKSKLPLQAKALASASSRFYLVLIVHFIATKFPSPTPFNPTLTKAGNCAGNCVEGSLSVLATVRLAVTRPGPGDPA